MVDRFLDWFERHKFGVVGTLMLHTMIMFIMAMSGLKNELPVKPPEQELALEFQPPAPEPEQPRSPEELAQEQQEVTNRSSNSAAEVETERSLSRTAQERISENVETDLHAFEQAEFDRLAEQRKAEGKEIVVPALDPSKWNKARYADKPVKAVKVEGLTTVSYAFVGEQRADVVLRVPAYKCKARGTVVIRISVDRDGEVQQAEIDRSKTTTADDCILSNALSSAENARFTHSASAPSAQQGTITYVFLAQ